jgi:hypothetical protein
MTHLELKFTIATYSTSIVMYFPFLARVLFYRNCRIRYSIVYLERNEDGFGWISLGLGLGLGLTRAIVHAKRDAVDLGATCCVYNADE